MLLDGYSAGWRISRSGSYEIVVSYSPQRVYDLALVFTAGTLVAALWIVALNVRRSRRVRRAGPSWRGHAIKKVWGGAGIRNGQGEARS